MIALPGYQGSTVIAARHMFTARYPAVAESVPSARTAVAALAARAGLGGERLDAIRLATSEAVTNVVCHAYPDGEGELQVDVGVVGDEILLLVADNGCGYQTPSSNPGLGLGFALIADAADQFVIAERAGGGTQAQMHFTRA